MTIAFNDVTSYVELESSSVERFSTKVRIPVDPDGFDAPQFGITLEGATSPASDGWYDGAWLGDWSSVTKTMEVLTPPFGTTGNTPTPTIEVVEGTRYAVWVRFQADANDTERPVRRVGTLQVN